MKLTRVRITDFQSIRDSNDFELGAVTCLVGKNESGKTALLKALYKLRPISEMDRDYNPVHDYPRSALGEYEWEVETGGRKPAVVARATFQLETDDAAAVMEVFGPSCFAEDSPSVTLRKGYSNQLDFTDLRLNCRNALRHLVRSANLPQQIAGRLNEDSSLANMTQLLREVEQTEAVQNLMPMLERIACDGLQRYIFDNMIEKRIPKFLYFDEFYQMKGQDNLEALLDRQNNGTLQESDQPLLGLFGLARLKLEQLIDADETETLIARLESAGNQLTQRALKYWSQNRHIRMRFDARPARPQDGPGMDSGTNIWGRVEDTRHMVTTPLRTRSRGFIWFFSFLAWYSYLRRQGENLILLLDEPGLSLHAKAQADLLRFFEEDLVPNHQLIYTTHSPFMVDPKQFKRVRIVQDRSIESGSEEVPDCQQGTKVFTEVLEATSDSLFPLQGALGYEITQTLFVGSNCLVVEGVSDLLYIQTISALLQGRGQSGLSDQWTITPVGGASNVSTFAALIGAQSDLNLALLIDFQKKDRQTIENLYKSKLVKKQQVLTFADFTVGDEADIEDMFEQEFYIGLVNREYQTCIKVSDFTATHPRIVYRLEEHIEENSLPGGARYNHYRPARYFSENIATLKDDLTRETLCRFQEAFDTLNELIRE